MFKNFSLDDVKLTDSYCAHRRELVKRYVKDFDIDRLMHTFLINAGLPSDAEPLGGWEAVECGLRGHFVGHYLSACARFAYADQDGCLKGKAYEIIETMEACAKPNGYLSAFEEDKLDTLELEENRLVWAPYYTLHKILQGLIDCHQFLGNEKALTLAMKLAYYIHGRFEKLSFWQIDGILRCTKVNPANEFGGIGDALYTLYDITRDAKVLALAQQFDRGYFLDPLAAGKDVLDDLHANTHLPMVLAAMHRYNITGEQHYKSAAEHFYHFVKGRTFANGNNSSKATAFAKGGVSERSEHWGGYGRLEEALTGGESESCCAHNTEKIVERMLEWSGSIECLDHLEQLKYNAILNSASHTTGLSQYHQPMGSGAVKRFSGLYDTFWCCTASGMEAMSELQKNIWLRSGDRLLLNAFISSTVFWNEKKVTIAQHTRFPDGLTSTLTIRTAEPTAFTLMLKQKAVRTVAINGAPIPWERTDGYILIERMFNDQDKIEITIDARLQMIPLQGSDRLAAMMFGPVLLAQLGPHKPLKELTSSSINDRFVRLATDRLEFVLQDAEGKPVSFIPLFRVEEEEYTVYLDLQGDSNSQEWFTYA
ncbi:glycoside hydrolase family 127 protein [Paenibacillus sp. PR3]|uniref:Glycoside hydrolase family 127 protein n=1 Tax=Paenibacillus terricola TaxID=2763503 RepID=A0ABR8MQL4_9BACL|nr:glycoside hydrolase family 127 protein [Paenibacillus terricola]